MTTLIHGPNKRYLEEETSWFYCKRCNRIFKMFLRLNFFLVFVDNIFSLSLAFSENVSFRDKSFNTFKLQRVSGCQISLDRCSQLCEDFHLCVSFFYKDGCDICQLHSVTFTDSTAGLTQTGWKYYSVNKTGKK